MFFLLLVFHLSSCLPADPVYDQQAAYDHAVKLLQGQWVNADYANVLQQTRSPYIAMQKAPYDVVTIDSTDNKHLLLYLTQYNYGQTDISPIEQYSFDNDWRFVKTAQWFAHVEAPVCTQNCPLLDVRLTLDDTLLVLRQYDADNQRYGSTEYKMLSDTCSTNLFLCRFDNFINYTVLPRRFAVTDSLHRLVADTVYLLPNGKLLGWDGQNKIKIWYFFGDYLSRYKFDVAELYPDKYWLPPFPREQRYTYTSDGNSVLLYIINEAMPQKGVFTVEKGRFTYKLTAMP